MSTMPVVVALETIILGGLTGYLHVRYAQANYPKSPRWQWALFLSGFICGATGTATITLYQKMAIHELLLFSLLGGIFLGLISRFLFPSNMQRIYPKR